ncbi:MAG: cytochrome P450 [Cyanobacteria bacterium J06632_19]
MNETIPLAFNPRSPSFRANPYPTYDYLRTHHPIYYRPEKKDWVLTRYADIVKVLKDPCFGHSTKFNTAIEFFSSKQSVDQLLHMRQESQNLLNLWLSLQNPPAHKRIRQVLHHAFTKARIQALRSHIQETVDRQIERVKDQGKMDIIADFAYPVAMDSICEVLGIPKQEQHSRFRQWSQELALGIDIDVTPISHERSLLALSGLTEYLRLVIAKSRPYPQDNLISTAIQAKNDGYLTQEELLANCSLMFFAGHSTTKYLIGTGILTLLRHQEQLTLLRTQPSLIKSTIDEMLRYDNSAQAVFRVALDNIKLSDCLIQKGENVYCIIGAANRDPAQFPEPDKFDIKRTPNSELSFGQGIHTCIGKHLANLVAEIAVGTLVQRLPNLSLATESLEWEETFLVRGLKSLPVVF